MSQQNSEAEPVSPPTPPRTHIEVKGEALAPFRGVSSVQAGLSRGTLFGVAGYALGNWMGGVGSRAEGAAGFNRLGHNTLGGMLGVTGFIVGAYIAMKQAQEAARQHYAMKKALHEMSEVLGTQLPKTLVNDARGEGMVAETERQLGN